MDYEPPMVDDAPIKLFDGLNSESKGEQQKEKELGRIPWLAAFRE
jgi:hypothetical protein